MNESNLNKSEPLHKSERDDGLEEHKMTKSERKRDSSEREINQASQNSSLYEKVGGEESIKILIDHWFQNSSYVYRQGKAL